MSDLCCSCGPGVTARASLKLIDYQNIITEQRTRIEVTDGQTCSNGSLYQ